MKGFVWYSFGSDPSGPQLAQALGMDHGKKTPGFNKIDVLIGWGCKMGEKYKAENMRPLVESRKLRILNSPEAIQNNRDKLATLISLEEEGEAMIPGFVDISKVANKHQAVVAVLQALESGRINLPLIGQNRYHKGSPVFCFTVEDIGGAILAKTRDEIHYFRTLDVGEELRIHVFRDTAIHAQTKVLSADPVSACAEHFLGKIRKKAEKEDRPMILGDDIQWVVRQLAGDFINSPEHAQKSLSKGWELKDMPVEEVPQDAIELALHGIEAVGLDMGAVSVSVGDEETARITGITSAPALSPALLKSYSEAIQEFVGEKIEAAEEIKPERRTNGAKGEEVAPPELIARISRSLRGSSKKQAEAALKVLLKSGGKHRRA